MKEVIAETVRLLERGESCVLATVVRTKGMTPQKAGAKQLFRTDGSSVGTLGGGCVEGDIWFLAKQLLKEHSGSQFREYYLNEEIAAKDGLVCGGTMYFYVQPLYPGSDFLAIAKEIVQAYAGGSALALATIVSCQNESSLGRRLRSRADGTVSGTLGDEKLDGAAVRIGKKVAPFAKNEHFTSDDGKTVFVEGFAPPPTLIIMGGGHVGHAVYQAAVPLGFRIIIVDDRPEFCNQSRFPLAAETIVRDFDKALADLAINPNTFVLVATRGHRFDDQATQAAVRTKARYIGLLGSRRKNLLIFRDLSKQGVLLERIREIHAPVGLDIGALTPEEIAISVIAEIIMVLRGGTGAPMKMTGDNFLEMLKKVPDPKKKVLPF